MTDQCLPGQPCPFTVLRRPGSPEVLWRVDYPDGSWVVFFDPEQANAAAERSGGSVVQTTREEVNGGR